MIDRLCKYMDHLVEQLSTSFYLQVTQYTLPFTYRLHSIRYTDRTVLCSVDLYGTVPSTEDQSFLYMSSIPDQLSNIIISFGQTIDHMHASCAGAGRISYGSEGALRASSRAKQKMRKTTFGGRFLAGDARPAGQQAVGLRLWPQGQGEHVSHQGGDVAPCRKRASSDGSSAAKVVRSALRAQRRVQRMAQRWCETWTLRSSEDELQRAW